LVALLFTKKYNFDIYKFIRRCGNPVGLAFLYDLPWLIAIQRKSIKLSKFKCQPAFYKWQNYQVIPNLFWVFGRDVSGSYFLKT
jgi:hypothetical protein